MNKLINEVLKISAISFFVTSVFCAINYILAMYTEFCFGVTLHGGEITTTMGLGIMMNKFYPITTSDEEITSSVMVDFDFVSFGITFLIIVAVLMLVKYSLKKVKDKKKIEE